MPVRLRIRTLLLGLSLLAACNGGAAGNPGALPGDGGEDLDSLRRKHADAGDAALDAGPVDAGDDAGTPDASPRDAGARDDAGMAPGTDDGMPVRQACSADFGGALNTRFGRLDGTLVSVVAPRGPKACNGDGGHVHLQVLMSGQIYDVAVNTDTLQFAADLPDPAGGPWAEGWHTGVHLDYAALGFASGDFANAKNDAQAIEDFVAGANHVSIFGTGYGPGGMHDVHRHGKAADGAIVIQPLSKAPRALLFRFDSDSF